MATSSGSYLQPIAAEEEKATQLGPPANLAPLKKKKKRSLAGNPDPDAEVIALSPRSLLATNRFICEVCNKGFQRDQNLQLHRRGHNLPWRLKSQASCDNAQPMKKRVYVCPEPGCVHHDPARALGDLTGIKKHFCRKHGEKKWKCERCSRRYAVQSDWKAHRKVCGTHEYRCSCGTSFSRRDSFINHRAFCDALAVRDIPYQGSSTKHGAIMQDISNVDERPKDSARKSSSCIIGLRLQASGNNVRVIDDVHDARNDEYHSVSTTMDSTSSPISQLTGEALTPQDATNFEPTSKANIATVHIPEDGTTSTDGHLGSIQDRRMPDVAKDPILCMSLAPFILPHRDEETRKMEYKYPQMHRSQKGEAYTYIDSNNMHHADSAPSASTHAMDMLASFFSPSRGNNTKSDSHKNGDNQCMKASELRLCHSNEKPATSISGTMIGFRSTKGGYNSGAPMSATALLQKASQMGAKVSNLSFLHKFGGALNVAEERPPITTNLELKESQLAGLSMNNGTFRSYYQPYVSNDMSKDTMTPNTSGVSSIKSSMALSLELSPTYNCTKATGSCDTLVNQHQGNMCDSLVSISSNHGGRHTSSSIKTSQCGVSTRSQGASTHIAQEDNCGRELLDFLGVTKGSSMGRGGDNHHHNSNPFHSHMREFSNAQPTQQARGSSNGVLHYPG